VGAFRARHHRRPTGDLIIGKVRVEDSSILDDRIVRQAIAVPLGKPLDLAALDENLMRVSAMGGVRPDPRRRRSGERDERSGGRDTGEDPGPRKPSSSG